MRTPDTLQTTMPRRSSSIRVLIVDDDAMSRELLTVLLEGEGYLVDSAESGEAALVLLERSDAIPDLVLTDMQLPGISGAELARALRNACGVTTVLLAISGSQPAAEVVALFDAFLFKPFHMSDVAAALRTRKPAAKKPVAKTTRTATAKELPAVKAVRRPPRSSSVASNLISLAASASQTASKTAMKSGARVGVTADAEQLQDKIDTPTNLPVLNEAIYSRLAGAMPGPQLQEMYMLCVGDTRQRIAGMRRHAAVHDDAQFIREAHAIKGGSGMLGATELHRRASELESHGLAGGSLGEMQDVNSLDELSAACDRLERMLGSRL
jgi:DNA-binding response OmpR family regulator/HPt (histidine-containing phosphotransfer) domain-containing protein